MLVVRFETRRDSRNHGSHLDPKGIYVQQIMAFEACCEVLGHCYYIYININKYIYIYIRYGPRKYVKSWPAGFFLAALGKHVFDILLGSRYL